MIAYLIDLYQNLHLAHSSCALAQCSKFGLDMSTFIHGNHQSAFPYIDLEYEINFKKVTKVEISDLVFDLLFIKAVKGTCPH